MASSERVTRDYEQARVQLKSALISAGNAIGGMSVPRINRRNEMVLRPADPMKDHQEEGLVPTINRADSPYTELFGQDLKI